MNLKIAHMYIPFDNKCGPGEHEVVEEEVALEVVSLSQAGNRVQSISHELLAIVFGFSP